MTNVTYGKNGCHPKPLFALPSFLAVLAIFFMGPAAAQRSGETKIARWQNNKRSALSITYDDGSRNQFKTALPMMEQMDLPATFFVITGPVKGSVYPPKFVGRPLEHIIAETATTPTSENNFYERASACLYLGYSGTLPYYNRADAAYESGKKDKAYRVMDSLYAAVRNHKLPKGKDTSMEMGQEEGLSWRDLQKDAARGYEIASHTVTHAHLAILDTANMGYELRKSKEEIRRHLGDKYTFSAEVPFGIEDPRVMRYGFPIYDGLRNMMPEPWMTEINRGYKQQPGNSDKEYVQWQRGPLSKTPMSLMDSWVDTAVAHNNIWLVLVFHGIDDLGWEPTPHQKLHDYFRYIKDRENRIWIAPFGEVARYMRERMNAKVSDRVTEKSINVTLSGSLANNVYDEPLTLITYVPGTWKMVKVKVGGKSRVLESQRDQKGSYVVYQAIPNRQDIYITRE